MNFSPQPFSFFSLLSGDENCGTRPIGSTATSAVSHNDGERRRRRSLPRRAARAVLVTSNAKPYQDAVSISKLQLLISPSVAFHPTSVAFSYSTGKHMKPLSSSASLRAASPSPLPSTTALAVT